MRDRATDTYVDHTKVRPIHFKGKYFSCRGPLNCVPSPHGRPAFIQAGGSPRGRKFAAEDVLHDIGAISMLGSDSHGMGRINEVVCRTWQLASKMKDQRGRLPEEQTRIGDNERIRRYIAKYTINAARTFGIAEHVGSLEDGKLADIVVWRPAFFGIKPELVIKCGFIVWGAMGDSAASLMTCEPLLLRPQWGAFGVAKQALSVNFAHPYAIESGLGGKLGLAKPLLPARGTRRLSRKDMLRNDACPEVRVDPQTFEVTADGVLATCDPARQLPLAQRYMLLESKGESGDVD